MPDDERPPRSPRAASPAPPASALVAGQGVRWAARTPPTGCARDEQADAATARRAMALADELVKQLGQMRGAAMKIGQVLSTVDFTAIPESEREEFKETLAALRDDVPPLPFKDMRKLAERELGGTLDDAFADFDERAVRRRVDRPGPPRDARTTADDVAVKVQYPGIAEAVETDLRNMQLLLPLVKRLAPGLDVKALLAELRERIGEELDYEIEAQNHRASRAPAAAIRSSTSRPSTRRSRRRRVLVTEFLDGRGFEDVKQLGEAERDRFGEIVFRFFFGLLERERLAAGDPHPGNYLLLDDGRVGFLDFGLMRLVDADYLDGEQRARPGRRRAATPTACTAAGRARLPARARRLRPRAPARAARARGRVVLHARLPPARPRVRARLRSSAAPPRVARTSRTCASRRSRRRRC